MNGRGYQARLRGRCFNPLRARRCFFRGRPPSLPFFRLAAALALLRTRPPRSPRRAAIHLADVPDIIKYHIDWEGIARDLELGGDVFTVDSRKGGVLVFSNN